MNLHTEFTQDLKQRTGSKFSVVLAMELLEIARKVHCIDEDFCNVDFTEKQRTYYESKRDELIDLANFMARALGALQIYHQADPRGWPLCVIFEGDIPTGENIDNWYNRGLAIPPRR